MPRLIKFLNVVDVCWRELAPVHADNAWLQVDIVARDRSP